jgi:hypothetical protein
MGPAMSSLPVAADAPVQEVSRVMADLLCKGSYQLNGWRRCLICTNSWPQPDYLLLSVVSAKDCQHDAIRVGSGEYYLGARGSSDDDRLRLSRLRAHPMEIDLSVLL